LFYLAAERTSSATRISNGWYPARVHKPAISIASASRDRSGIAVTCPALARWLRQRDEGEVHEKLATLPLARAGMLDFEIVPLKPYAGFSLP
jgi:hypothetical protein